MASTQILSKEKEIDPELIKLAVRENRVIVTHDKNTFPKYAYEEMTNGKNISGVLIVPNDLPIGEAINELEIIITCSDANEFKDRVEFLPLDLS